MRNSSMADLVIVACMLSLATTAFVCFWYPFVGIILMALGYPIVKGYCAALDWSDRGPHTGDKARPQSYQNRNRN